MKGSRSRSLAAVLLAATLLVPNTAFAMGAKDFTDVKESYWGYPYIDFAASVGIINGYTTAKGTYVFQPENPVTKCEAAKMIYAALTGSSLGFAAEDYSEKWKETLDSAKILEWARPYVSYGLEKGYLTADEVSAFISDSAAQRQQVATWVGRALEALYQAEGRPASLLQYKDAADMAEEALPYIDLLYRLEIMQGDVGTFLPQNTIKRVEFAAVCNRIYSLPEKEWTLSRDITTVQGTVTAVSEDKTQLTLTGTGSAPYTIKLENSDATVFFNGIASSGGFAQVQEGQDLVISWGAAKDQIHLETAMVAAEGTIVSIGQKDPATGYQLVGLRLTSGATAYYYLNTEEEFVTVTGTPYPGGYCSFLTDGVILVELTIK
ncbi:MAG: S-layer homology domain-containing protein [Clostridiales bacterium]|nr:S-layer homology domain-containing protein [Clostridiales bacterium]